MQGPWASCCPGPLLVSFGPSPLFFLGEENNDLFATTPDLLKKRKVSPLCKVICRQCLFLRWYLFAEKNPCTLGNLHRPVAATGALPFISWAHLRFFEFFVSIKPSPHDPIHTRACAACTQYIYITNTHAHTHTYKLVRHPPH